MFRISLSHVISLLLSRTMNRKWGRKLCASSRHVWICSDPWIRWVNHCSWKPFGDTIQIRCIFLSLWRHHTNHTSDMSGFSVPQILDDLVTFHYVPLDLPDVSVLRPEPLTSEQLQQHILSWPQKLMDNSLIDFEQRLDWTLWELWHLWHLYRVLWLFRKRHLQRAFFSEASVPIPGPRFSPVRASGVDSQGHGQRGRHPMLRWCGREDYPWLWYAMILVMILW